VHGVLILDKPRGVSSAAAVNKVKKALRASRAGHGGTLDPMATGVLAVCLGAATKIAPYLLADDKEYEAEGMLGFETDTLDATGDVIATREVNVTREALEAAITARRGEQDQMPPMYSALKQQGQRLYRLARVGEVVERAVRRIRIDRLELVDFASPRFTVSIACSKGTYVRSLVADIGADVGAGAHLTALRRTRSGRFSIAQAVSLADVEAGTCDIAAALVAPRDAVDLPCVTVHGDQITTIRNGVQVPLDRMGAEGHERFQLVDDAGRMLAICHAHEGKVIYDRVLAELMTQSVLAMGAAADSDDDNP
jgi:tRNA pseudouridine55 synthase